MLDRTTVLVAHGHFISFYDIIRGEFKHSKFESAPVSEIFRINLGQGKVEVGVVLQNNELYRFPLDQFPDVIRSTDRKHQIEGTILKMCKDNDTDSLHIVIHQLADKSIKASAIYKEEIMPVEAFGILQNPNIVKLQYNPIVEPPKPQQQQNN